MLLLSNLFSHSSPHGFNIFFHVLPLVFKTKKALLAQYSHRLWLPQEKCSCETNAAEALAALNIPSAYEDRVGWRTLELGKIDVRMFLSKDIDTFATRLGEPYMGRKSYRGYHGFAKHNATCIQLHDQPSFSQLEYLSGRDLLHFPFPEDIGIKKLTNP